MIIAILLCMAFVVNIGATLASINYNLNATSINVATPNVNTNTFIEFGSAKGAKGSFEYVPGVYNNQLSINYGFNSTVNYDLMIEFTATYTDTEQNNGANTHFANDFTMNLVNRDDWCVDMGVKDSVLVDDATAKYYAMGSSSSTLTGVMYYTKTLSGSGNLPVISGVTFHTSSNNSYKYLGDKLTITLNPKYVKSNADNYTADHAFSSSIIDANAFSNWYNYMAVKAGKTVDGWSSKIMIYNAHNDEAGSIGFPHDPSVMKTQIVTDENDNETITTIVNSNLKDQPNYANTAYRYKLVEENGVDTPYYDAMTAGNKYEGGLGVYVLPDSNLLTISVSLRYSWYDWENQESADFSSVKMVSIEYSDEIQTVTATQGAYRYYRGTIDSPTYIDVLKHIRLSAEDNSSIITGGYKLIIHDVTVETVTEANQSSTLHKDISNSNNDWEKDSYTKPNYQIHNPTTTAPILVRAKDVATGYEEYDTDIAITNNGTQAISINGFTISSKLWYGNYQNSESTFSEQIMGSGYLPREAYADEDLHVSALKYDTNLWQITNYSAGVFTFGLVPNKSIYIPKGYSLTLISGVAVPATAQTDDYSNDFWCSLGATVSASNVSANVDYSITSSTSVEVITEGYYTAINDDTAGKIYIRNNSNQVITGVQLSNLKVYILDDQSTLMSRDKATANVATYSQTSHLSGNVSIKPGEMVLAYTILPTTADEDAIISSFDIAVTLATQQVAGAYVAETSDIDLVYSESTNVGMLTNNSEKYYEFRLISTTSLTTVLYNSNDFVEKTPTNANGETEYHYYYKGIICPHRSIQVLTKFVPNIVVDYLEHNIGADEDYYVASNYSTSWGFDADNAKDTEWLNFMKNLYEAPTTAERQSATVIN